ncbi:fungal-specific transcription factor domain-containing protein [Aspergillus bertholletiae]|uniref:Fungal-specific transcription factor domain-containing protein n=1 Tax=Aspergillus bertholletiae TaxID=1226010 RepID=A0A5N7BHN4_9EURO|nr:fungal-specific transcription factor domain-containing protein [Aspergillus bertholletiae]
MVGAIRESSSNPEFFGSSSAGFFMRQINAGIDSSLEFQSPRHGCGGCRTLGPVDSLTACTATRLDRDYVLPSRKMADALLKAYWDTIYPVYPFVDRASFEKNYQALWTGSEMQPHGRIVVGTVNIIFALGAQVLQSIPPERRQATGRVYYERARGSLEGLSWDTSSLDLVAALLLMGVFLQTMNTPQRCWMVIGHAIRMGQSLGIHLLCPKVDGKSRRETEMARRVWHGCVLLDRVLSMTFGRPGMISASLSTMVPLPLAVDDDFLDRQEHGSPMRPDGRPCVMTFYVAQLQFYSIIDDILRNLYVNSSEERGNQDDIAIVLRLDNALVKWMDNLPEYLRTPSLDVSDSLIRRLAIINTVRFLHARILLFRPILTQLCLHSHRRPTSIESLAQRTALQCSNLCLTASHQIIDMIYANLDFAFVTGPLPSWWYCVLYVYTAATVLVAERLQPAIADGISEYSYHTSWAHAFDILTAYSRVGDSAKRCITALEALSARIPPKPGAGDSCLEANIDLQGPFMPLPFDLLRDEIALGDSLTQLSEMAWLHDIPGSV